MEPGTQLGHYEILSAIGKGGMGEVWRAKDTKLGRDVAIKTLPAEFAQDADRLARFEREAKLLASLNHPNIAAIYGLEEHEGSRFLVLELVEGDTLADRFKRGAIPVEESLALALQIAEALEAAHEKGVIHRDLKPANVKVTSDGKVKVLDFGLARAFTGDQADANLSNSPTLSMQATQQGVILGTAAYMSPEQARGETADQRADVWAFGVVLFEMLTGHEAFGGRTVSDVLASVLKTDPAWNSLPANLQPRIQFLLERCLEKESKERCQSVTEARAELQKAMSDPGGLLIQPVADVSEARRRSAVPWIAAVVLAAISGIAGWSVRPPTPVLLTKFEEVLPDGRGFRGLSRRVLTVAPDGRKYVYNGTDGLYLRTMDDPEARVIPGTEEPLTNPTFSPNGEWVAYWAEADLQLQKIQVVGGTPVPLIDLGNNPFGISWDVEETILVQTPEGIVSVPSDGGESEVVVPATEVFIGYPQLLPGGDSVLFATAGGEVVIHSIDSGESQPLFPGTSPRYVSTGHIVYTRDNVLSAVAFDPASAEVTGGHVPMVEGIQGAATGSQYSVSDSGALAYVVGGTALDDVRTLAFVNQQGVVEQLDVAPARFMRPRVSPSGEQIAVEIVGDDGQVEIWIYDLAGEVQPRNLTTAGSSIGPTWTPDGNRITYFSSGRADASGIFWKNADGSGVEDRLTTSEDGIVQRPASWHPDGEILAFSRQDPSLPAGSNVEVWTLSLDSGEVEAFSDTPAGSMSEFSLNGDWIAYATGGQISLSRFPYSGERYPITTTGEITPVWSRNGLQLFYRRSGAGGVTIPIVSGVEISTEPSVTWGEQRELPVPGFFTAVGARTFDVHPDGRFIMVLSTDGSDSRSQINVALNWFEELKERVPVP